MFGFLSSNSARILTIVLLLQAAAFYGLARTEPVRQVNPLSEFPQSFGGWKSVKEGTLDKETLDILKADDIISRWYGNGEEKNIASLFIAYFNTQRTGKAPHSPKNCLPGSGWLPVVNDRIQIPIEGRAEPVEANRYVVARGDDKSLVIYWYQTQKRTVASEYKAKVYTVIDSLRYNRSDVAIVKVTIPIRTTYEDTTEMAKRFIQAMFNQLTPYFPA